jgi:hypothetical protein
MSPNPPHPAREVIAETVRYWIGGWATDPVADRVLEALRSRGYAIVPIEPTDLMMDQGTDPLYWPTFLPSRLVREVWMWMLYGAGAISKEQMHEIKGRIGRLAAEPSTIQSAAPPKDTR